MAKSSNQNPFRGRRFFAEVQRLMKQFDHRGCFHQDPHCTRISNAHSIQEKRILSEIAENGHVLVMDLVLDDNGFQNRLVRRGINKACTFTGLCNYHDSMIFRPIDNSNYLPGNKQQEFLFAYRALARQWQVQHSVTSFLRHLLGLTEPGGIEELQRLDPSLVCSPANMSRVNAYTSAFLAGHERSLVHLEYRRQIINTYLDKGEYHTISTLTLEFSQKYRIAVSSVFFPEKDFEGATVNDPLTTRRRRPLYLTVLPQQDRTYVLIGYETEDKDTYDFLRDRLADSDEAEQKVIVSNIIAVHAENFAVSPKMWTSLPSEQQHRFLNLFNSTRLMSPIRLLVDPLLNVFV